MPKITLIPERYADGIKKISSISDATYKEVLEGLSYTSLVASMKVLAENVANAHKLDNDLVRQILFSAGSLTPFIEVESDVDEVVSDIAVLALNDKLVQSDNESVFKKRLAELIKSRQIYYAWKGNRLMTEHSNVFLQTRIITDIRPVFSYFSDGPPSAAMIIHNFHIHYQADAEGDHKDFFIALDSKDIKVLKEALIRAEKKEQDLQNLLQKAGVINLNE